MMTVLPPFASSFSRVFSSDADFPGLELPEALSNAVCTRKLQFLAGRYCAARAISQLGGHATACTPVARGCAGEPIWPHGLAGSITHTGHFAWAAVVRRGDAPSIGIDSEQILTAASAKRISAAVLRPGETPVCDAALDTGLLVTLAFSAKEAVFKCLFPLIRQRFYYDAVALSSIDVQTRCFSAELQRSLSPRFCRGHRIRGRFDIDEAHVHTATWLAPEAPVGDVARC